VAVLGTLQVLLMPLSIAEDRKAEGFSNSRPGLAPAGFEAASTHGDLAFGGMSRAAKGADCKSAGVRLRRFESYFPHHAHASAER
jgi:hypothetical protein